MPDEVSIFAKLGSWLYGSLIHTTGVLRQAFEADVTAVRIYKVSDFTEHHCYVDTAPLGLTHQQNAVIQKWPAQPGSLFEQLESLPRSEGAQRLQDRIKTLETHPALFQGAGLNVEVRDCMILEVSIIDPLWAAVAVMRCGSSEAFNLSDLRALDQIKPAMTHLLRVSCHRQGIGLSHAHGQLEDGQPHKLSAEQMIARLTRMECQVLHYLRLGCTERQISQEIHRSQHTVHVHVKNIYRKLNISSRKQLIDTFNDADSA